VYTTTPPVKTVDADDLLPVVAKTDKKAGYHLGHYLQELRDRLPPDVFAQGIRQIFDKSIADGDSKSMRTAVDIGRLLGLNFKSESADSYMQGNATVDLEMFIKRKRLELEAQRLVEEEIGMAKIIDVEPGQL